MVVHSEGRVLNLARIYETLMRNGCTGLLERRHTLMEVKERQCVCVSEKVSERGFSHSSASAGTAQISECHWLMVDILLKTTSVMKNPPCWMSYKRNRAAVISTHALHICMINHSRGIYSQSFEIAEISHQSAGRMELTYTNAPASKNTAVTYSKHTHIQSLWKNDT